MVSQEDKNLTVYDLKYPTNYFKSLDNLRKSHAFVDIKLRAAGEEYDAHKVVLSAASPFFNAMFIDEFAESKQETIDLKHETNSVVMTAVMNYIYSGELTIPMGNVALLVRNFDYFQMEDVKVETGNVLLQKINTENCLEFLIMADEIGLINLHEKAVALLTKDFTQIYYTAGLKQLSYNKIKYVLSIVASLHPDPVCKAILSWVKYDETNRKVYMHELLSKYVDYKKLSEDLISKKVPKYLLNDEFFTESEDCSRWLLESLLGVKRPNVFLFSMKAESPFYSFNIANNCLTQLGKQTTLNYFSPVKFNNSIYAVGGQTKNGINEYSIKYDISKKVWSKLPFAVTRNQCGVCVEDGKLFVAGGWINGKGSDSFSSYEFESGIVTKLPKMEFERWSPALVTYNSSLYVFGGHSIEMDNGEHDVVERYDPREGKWSNAGLLSLNDMGCTAAVVGEIICCKGWNSGLHTYEPRCLMSEIVTESAAFGTITCFDQNLYLAHEQGISKYIPDKETWMDLFISSLNSCYIVA